MPRAAVGPKSLRAIRLVSSLQARVAPKRIELVRAGGVSVRVHRPSVEKGAGGRGLAPGGRGLAPGGRGLAPGGRGLAPGGRGLAGLLWVHGGGYVIGTAAQDDVIARALADRLGIVVAAVEYRLAPEHRFPAPLEDCYDALRWLAHQPDIDASRIAIGGASAGGGLAAALALLTRERGDVRPVFQLLAYPMLDDRTALRTDIDESGFRLWNNRANAFGWQAYTGHPPGSPEISALAAPAREKNLSELPPAWIGVGTLDLFYEEALDYSKRLRAAGVDCTLEVVPGAFHGFDSVLPKTSVSRTFRSAQIAALSTAFVG